MDILEAVREDRFETSSLSIFEEWPRTLALHSTARARSKTVKIKDLIFDYKIWE